MPSPHVCTLHDGTPLTLRRVTATDGARLESLVTHMSARDRRWRFHGGVNGLTAARLHAMTNPGASEVALVATVEGDLVADVRCVVDVTGSGAEFALMVASAWRRRGVAQHCIADLGQACADLGLRWLHGIVMADNAPMLALLRRSGFHCSPSRNDSTLMVAERCIDVSTVH